MVGQSGSQVWLHYGEATDQWNAAMRLDGLKHIVREWIEKGEDPRQNNLYKFSHGVTDEMIAEVEKEIALGVFWLWIEWWVIV